MSVRFFVAFIALAILTGFAPVPKPRPPKGPDPKEMAKNMQGTWQVVGTERAGFKGKVASSLTRQVQITGTSWQYIYNNDGPGGPRLLRTTTSSYTITLDTSKAPVTMDLKRATSDSVYLSGIVTVEGDTMKFCYVLGSRINAGEGVVSRPQAFDPLPEGAILMTLKRVKP